MRFTTLATALIACAAAETARGGDTTPVAEIVTFRLQNAADAAAFVTAAAEMTPLLESTGAFLSRTLSVDDAGLWTDHLTWTSMAEAKKAAEEIMQKPQAAPFMQLIDPETVTLRHAPIQFSLKME